MSKLLFILAISIISSATFAHNAKQQSPFKKTTPPGTVLLEGNLFIDATEISNISWLEYRNWLKQTNGDSSENYINSMPDTTVWEELGSFDVSYFDHPAFNNYPVVGISFQQAIAYCKWRTDRVNEMIYLKANKIDYSEFIENKNEHQVPKTYTYRLPTQTEWEKVYYLGYSKKVMKKQAKCFEKNEANSSSVANHLLTAPVKSNFANIAGVYHIGSNVTEMSNVEGIGLGNSWKPEITKQTSSLIRNYNQPNNWVGFRCVCIKN